MAASWKNVTYGIFAEALVVQRADIQTVWPMIDIIPLNSLPSKKFFSLGLSSLMWPRVGYHIRSLILILLLPYKMLEYISALKIGFCQKNKKIRGRMNLFGLRAKARFSHTHTLI
jgi:hypothetical protein